MRHNGCFGVWIAVAGALGLAMASCAGQIGADEPGATASDKAGGAGSARGGGATAPTGGAGGLSGPTSGGPSVPPPGIATTACGSTVDPGYVGMRRLTRVEYNNTVRDLLGDNTRPALAFPNDDSVLAAQSQVSGLYFEKHEAVAERLVNEAWTRETSGKQPPGIKLLVCAPKAGDAACARNIVTTFAKRAWRRPVTAVEIEPFVGLVALAEKNGEDAAAGVRLALQAVLEASDFLFRIEPDTTTAARRLTAHELASRLSYWFWSTMPDERLTQLADAGTLPQTAVLGGELSRMLADPKAAAFAEGFVGHWLSLGSLASSQPDPTLSGGFDEPLRQAMTGETLALFRAFLTDSLRFSNILEADFSFVNDRLARHYGLTPPANAVGADLRRVPLAPGPRRGLLAHGGLLTMTSGPTNTSPVKRGKFVSTYLLCTKPPPPPPGADALVKEASSARTERERLAIHRRDPQCAACHSLMDPIGLGLENFDLVGRYRRAYANGAAIDASGELAGGGGFHTFEELRALLAADARVPGCVAEQMFVYAVGRELGPADECVRKGVMERFNGGGRLTDLVAALAGSPPFVQRRAEGAGGTP